MTSSMLTIGNFHCFLVTAWEFGTDANGEARRYVSHDDLKRYWTSELISSVLQSCTHPSPIVDAIEKSFLRIFSILVFIDRPQYLKVFQRREITDANLPIPEHWPYKTDEGNDFQLALKDFYQNQWAFCPVELDNNIMYKRKLDNRQILPFMRERDRSAPDVHKIIISSPHSSYKQPTQKQVLALKVLTGDSQRIFDAELEALAALSRKSSKHIVQCMGSYVHGNNYNLILEYADQGSLGEYLQRSSPPRSALELQQFWNSMIDILQGLHQIHNTSFFDTKTASMVGIHGDIKPQNIMVFGNNEQSPYDLTLKICGFGISAMKFSAGSRTPVVDTDTYSAPGYSSARIDRRREQANDIWSLGCIYIELIVWIISGSDGLKGFRDRRAKELCIRKEWELAFHNGTAPLNEVSMIYEHARSRLKPFDDWTGIVLDLVENHMLVSSTNGRLGAKDIHRLWKERAGMPTRQAPMVDSEGFLQSSTRPTSPGILNHKRLWDANESATDIAERELRCMDSSSLNEFGAISDTASCSQEFIGEYQTGSLERHRTRKHEELRAYKRRYSPCSTSASKRNPLYPLDLGIQRTRYQKGVGREDSHPHDTTISA